MNDDWQGLNLSELIDLLEPAPEPLQISLLPQTAGWFWLGLIALVGLGWFIWQRLLHRQKNAYRRQALAELEECQNDPRELALLLRRTALSAFPRSEVASLHGQEWLAFLDRTYPGRAFLDGPGKQIVEATYQKPGNDKNLKPLVAEWIRAHRSESA